MSQCLLLCAENPTNQKSTIRPTARCDGEKLFLCLTAGFSSKTTQMLRENTWKRGCRFRADCSFKLVQVSWRSWFLEAAAGYYDQRDLLFRVPPSQLLLAGGDTPSAQRSTPRNVRLQLNTEKISKSRQVVCR